MTLKELETLFPQEIKADGSLAKVVKFTCVRTPTSVYETLPGTEEARPLQTSPIPNFFCAGDFSKQKYLASMEGAILSGKLAARVVSDQHLENERSSTYSPPRQLTERPRDPSAPDVNEQTEVRTMYVAKTTTSIPAIVKAELEMTATR